MNFYYALDKLFDVHTALKYDINDERILDAIKKTILVIFNKYGEKVYNKTENSFYKRIMDKNTCHYKAMYCYRYYPNGLVYYVNFGSENKNTVDEEYPLPSMDNFIRTTIMLKEYKIPTSFEKKIEINREKIKEEQLKTIDKQKKREAKRKATADKKEAIKAANIEKQRNPCLDLLDRAGYLSRKIYGNFVCYQVSKWYKDIKKPVIPKIFKDNPPLYKIMEKLNKINEDINLKTVIKDFHYEYQVKNDCDKYIYTWNWGSNIVGKYPDIVNLNIAREEMDKLIRNKVCNNYDFLINKIINTLFNTFITDIINKDSLYMRNINIKTDFVLIKDKDSFEYIRTKKHDTSYRGLVLLDTVKYTNEIDVKLSDKCLDKSGRIDGYKRGTYDGKNIIAFPYLSAICEAWPVFIEKVKECEYGEEWLERVGFIPPKKDKNKK